jgi:hypothetical protein
MGLTTDRTDECIQLIRPDGMQECYLILPEEERAKGYVRPVRTSYIHVTCGTETRMAEAIAETYARNPEFYGGTYCVGCRTHFPLLEWNPETQVAERKFKWLEGGAWDGSYVGE